LREVVKAFIGGDYDLSRGVPYVAPVSSKTAKQVREYVADYGETLAELPDETWESSVSEWTGADWHLRVDLWTEESGESDMVLDARVAETENGYQIVIDSVYVP